MDQQKPPTIPVVTGTGTGSTELSAFDAALRDAGVANFNLVRLSSVVPHCVYAEQRASVPGEQAWAGVGWVQRVDGGGGLSVEHEGDSEEIVSKLIGLSLADLVAGRPEAFGLVQQVRTGVTCTEAPVCALVVAAYETVGWEFAR